MQTIEYNEGYIFTNGSVWQAHSGMGDFLGEVDSLEAAQELIDSWA